MSHAVLVPVAILITIALETIHPVCLPEVFGVRTGLPEYIAWDRRRAVPARRLLPPLLARAGRVRGAWKSKLAGRGPARAAKPEPAAAPAVGADGQPALRTATTAAMGIPARWAIAVPAGRVPADPTLRLTAHVPLFPPPVAAGLLPVMRRIADKLPLVPAPII